MFVDGYDFAAYEGVGLGKMELGQDVPEGIMSKIGSPDLGGVGGWWKYLTNVAKISPISEGSTGFPEGVKVLGGTFVVRGDEVVYQYNDPVPGATPDLQEVMKAV